MTTRFEPMTLLLLLGLGCTPPATDVSVGPPDSGLVTVLDTSVSSDSDQVEVQDLVGSELVEMVRVPSGEFVMGTPAWEVGRGDDETQHLVQLTQDFFMGTYELTQEEFEAVMGYNPSEFADCARCPAENVTFSESAAFCNALSLQEGYALCYECEGEGADVTCVGVQDPYHCDGFRLPTEAEWEYAARSAGVVSGAFIPGSQLRSDDDARLCEEPMPLSWGPPLNQIGWYCGNSNEQTHPVGELLANELGLYDMAGNVWEICHDYYAPYPGDAIDPWGPNENPNGRTVGRGGSGDSGPSNLRLGRRNNGPAIVRNWHHGFRIARTAR